MYYPVCILVMAHSHEEMLLKLLKRLRHPQVFVFVHIDRKSQLLYEKLSQQDEIKLIQNRVNVQWAHITQVQTLFSSYKEIKINGFSFDHLLVISGQDYPTQPIDKLVKYLAVQQGKSLISYVPLTKEGWSSAMKRYRYHYYIRMEKLWRGLMMLTGIRRQFPFGLNPYGGAQWVNLAQKHVEYIISYCETHVSLMNFMKTVRFPEEIIFQTLLLNSEHKNDCINNDLRFIKWLPGKSGPEILTEHNFHEIKQAADKFFARKFDEQLSIKLVRLLDEQNK